MAKIYQQINGKEHAKTPRSKKIAVYVFYVLEKLLNEHCHVVMIFNAYFKS
jgi:hypothetical protein